MKVPRRTAPNVLSKAGNVGTEGSVGGSADVALAGVGMLAMNSVV